jgi:hypothetical protein
MRVSFSWTLALAAGLSLGLVSCSSTSGPPPVKPGTPPFFWAAANEAYKKGDFAAVVKNLGNLTGKENEYRLKAQVWIMVVDAGLARGDMEWADLLEDGGKKARAKQLDFRKLMNDSRNTAAQSALRVADLAHRMLPELKEDKLPVAFRMPDVNKDKPVETEKIAKGLLPPEAELENMRLMMQKRGVLQSVARFGDPGGDIAKATAALSAADATVTRDAFLMYLAGEFSELSTVFGPKKLDRAGRAKLMLEEAVEALAQVPASAAKAKLQKKIDEQMKKLPKSQS